MRMLPRGPAALDVILGERDSESARPAGWEWRTSGTFATRRRSTRCTVDSSRRGGPQGPSGSRPRIAAAILGREAWKRLGFVRLADYAREGVGISPRELQELGRVGAKLDDLPAGGSARRGPVCWSKARLVARIATPADEQEWIECAERLTTRELRKKIRAAQAESGNPSVEPADDDELPTQFFELACSARCSASGIA